MPSPSHTHVHGTDDSAFADLLDLDAEVLHDHLFEVTNWVRAHVGSAPRRRILDLGAGTGTGTMALASRFPQATIVAVDMAPTLLAAVRAKAVVWGVANRVSTAQVDLDSLWPVGPPADLIWAASALHELSHPNTVLANAYRGLTAGGLLAVIEMDAPPRFFSTAVDSGAAQFESRVHAILAATSVNREDHPDWGPRLRARGFDLVETRTFAIDLPSPQPAATGRYAAAYFRRIAPVVIPRLTADDRATLDVLLSDTDPRSLLRRADLTVQATRTAWVARAGEAPGA
jgi:ubiquinone/menaquinone biosynthesis C-methylase UbiE